MLVLKFMLIAVRIPKSYYFKVFHIKYSLILLFFMILYDISAAHAQKSIGVKSDPKKIKTTINLC